MKLKQYFNEKKTYRVSSIDKLDIYQKFISKRNLKSFENKRSFFVVKSFIYSFIFIFLFIGLYGTYIFNGNFIINKDGFFIQKSDSLNLAQAEFIAKIIEFNGDFYISHNSEYYKGTYISNKDLVTLKKGSDLLFHIDKGTEAKVIGPAKFQIIKGNQSYKINLIYGDFIKLKSLSTENPQNIEFLTENISIKQGNSKQPIDFQLIKDGLKTLVKNNGPQLIITQTNSENKEIQKELNPNIILAIQDNDISIIENKKLSQILIQKKLTQTSLFNEIYTETTQEDINEILNKEYGSENYTEITKNIGLPNDKIIPNEEQLSKITSNLNRNTISKDLEKIKEYYIQGNENIEIYIQNIKLKIKQTYNVISINYENNNPPNIKDNIIELNNNIKNLYSVLDEKYHIPPIYIQNLQKLEKELANIIK